MKSFLDILASRKLQFVVITVQVLYTASNAVDLNKLFHYISPSLTLHSQSFLVLHTLTYLKLLILLSSESCRTYVTIGPRPVCGTPVRDSESFLFCGKKWWYILSLVEIWERYYSVSDTSYSEKNSEFPQQESNLRPSFSVFHCSWHTEYSFITFNQC